MNPSPGLDPTVSIFVDNYLTELSSLAKRLCLEARIEATTEVFEDEGGHIRVYPPAGLNEEEIADIEGKLADRRVDLLIERGVLFAPQFMTDRTAKLSVTDLCAQTVFQF